uniref:Transcription elongation regulator 1-like protein n=1 Tax=Sphenodon punctatus TaxID=8508 RepID=A0A8D0H4C5_SPHPU
WRGSTAPAHLLLATALVLGPLLAASSTAEPPCLGAPPWQHLGQAGEDLLPVRGGRCCGFWSPASSVLLLLSSLPPPTRICRCIVWTGDDRVFFFNPTMQLSVWEKPVDLKNRGDINRIIEDPPHKRKLETSATDKSDSSSPEDISDDHSTKTKRNKVEDPPNADEEKIEAEEKNAKTSAHQIMLPLEERITHFRDMLLERGVSAFSTWEKELHKIVFDPRYLLLNSEERKQIFEQFVKTRIREEYKEKKNKLLLAKEEFKKLLEESKLSPRTTFKEFAEKYGRDQRFRLVQKKKDQEHFFNQFILILKKRDKENRIRLRKMR